MSSAVSFAIAAGGRRDFLHICRCVRGIEALHISQVHGSERVVHHRAERGPENVLLHPVVDTARPARLLVSVGMGFYFFLFFISCFLLCCQVIVNLSLMFIVTRLLMICCERSETTVFFVWSRDYNFASFFNHVIFCFLVVFGVCCYGYVSCLVFFFCQPMPA